MTQNVVNSRSSIASRFGRRSLILVVLIAVAGFGWWQFRDALSFEYLARREVELRTLQAERPLLVFGLAFLIYVSVTGLSLPGATVLTLAFAWFFGFWPALVLISFASTSGATVAFLSSRYILRDAVQQRFGERLIGFNRRLEQDGAFYLFMLRLIPVFPFFMINLVMGLTPLRAQSFWWISQTGMLPGTAVYVYAGASVPDLQTLASQGASSVLTPRLLAAFAILGVFPLAIRKVDQRLRPANSKTELSQSQSGCDGLD